MFFSSSHNLHTGCIERSREEGYWYGVIVSRVASTVNNGNLAMEWGVHENLGGFETIAKALGLDGSL